jgi:hypothetical protein
MWQKNAYEKLPIDSLKQSDGTYAVYEGLCRQLEYESEVGRVVEWFLDPQNFNKFCQKPQENDEDKKRSREDVWERMRAELSELENCGSNDDDQEMVGLNTDDVLPSECLPLALTNACSEGDSLGAVDSPNNEENEEEVDPSTEYERKKFFEPAYALATFIAEISYMVIETRGLQHFATPDNKVLQKSVFQDLQHGERGYDVGNRIYGYIYDTWVYIMTENYAQVLIPTQASKKKSSPAGNILESYKTIAENVLDAERHPARSPVAATCIEAAKVHLVAAGWSVPDCHFPVHICFETTYGYTGCVVWLFNVDRARDAAQREIDEFSDVRPMIEDSKGDSFRVHRDISSTSWSMSRDFVVLIMSEAYPLLNLLADGLEVILRTRDCFCMFSWCRIGFCFFQDAEIKKSIWRVSRPSAMAVGLQHEGFCFDVNGNIMNVQK